MIAFLFPNFGKYDMELIEIISSLMALIILEIVLGVDNLVFISILSDKLPVEKRRQARRLGLSFAWVTRLILLAAAVWLVRLTKPVLILSDLAFSIRDLFLLAGGFFLIAKATQEIHSEVTAHDEGQAPQAKYASVFAVVLQIGFMDILFSFDSVLTAVGLTSHFWIMAVAITCAIFVMIYASEPVSWFIDKYPTLKMLALSFLILIGMVLIADGFSFHIPRGYVYFAMGFSLAVEALNLFRQSHRN